METKVQSLVAEIEALSEAERQALAQAVRAVRAHGRS
jgi:hypothetical protein